MFSPRGRGRGSRPSWLWLLRASTSRKLLVLLSICAFVAFQLYFYNSTTRRYKDCSVPWPTAAGHDGSRRNLFSSSSSDDGGGRGSNEHDRIKIVLVSMSTGRSRDSKERLQRQAAVNTRSAEFAGLLDITGPNKQQYAEQHGYSYVDASDLLDDSRPASWSKIPAVLSVLERYDWVFWLDADTLVTNTSLPVEALLPLPELAGSGADAAPDLLLTADSTGVNAGVWLMRGRGCVWCRSFLELWWSQESFIRRGAHDTKSGDNDALKHLVAHMERSELAAHVGVAPQCSFNSYLWRPSVRNYLRYLYNPRHILTGLWQPGDFVMHAAGVHNKMAVLRRFTDRYRLVAAAQPLALGELEATQGLQDSGGPVQDADKQRTDSTAVIGSNGDRGVEGERLHAGLAGLRGEGRELLRSFPSAEGLVSRSVGSKAAGDIKVRGEGKDGAGGGNHRQQGRGVFGRLPGRVGDTKEGSLAARSKARAAMDGKDDGTGTRGRDGDAGHASAHPRLPQLRGRRASGLGRQA